MEPAAGAGETKKRRSVMLIGAAGLMALAAGGTYYWYSGAESGTERGSRGARAAIPVTVAAVTRQDVPVYLTGIGTVQAMFTIDIHAKVDGELTDVLFTEGQPVNKGDVLAKIDPRLYQAALDQAKAKRAQDAAALVAAEKDLARAKTLALKSFDTQQNVDQLQAKVGQVTAAIAADEAMIETAQAQYDYTTIAAPSAGRIGIRLVDPGNFVRASDQKSLATLVLTQPAAVLFTLPATALTDIRDALKRGPVEVTALDQDNRLTLGTGKLLLIDNVIDQTTATIRLKALFANDDEALWPGAFVNARVLAETRRDALTVPAAAVQSGPRGLFAWVVGGDNTAEPRTIEVGPATGDLTVVTSGLAAGDRVVIAGQYKLQPKVPVVTAAPPASAAASDVDR
jgi:multidrug efflux system membrane fusion protein